MLSLNQMHLQGYMNSITRGSDCWRNPSSLVDACIKKLALDKVLQKLEVFSEQWGFRNNICERTWALSPSRTYSWAKGRGHSRWNNKQLIFESLPFSHGGPPQAKIAKGSMQSAPHHFRSHLFMFHKTVHVWDASPGMLLKGKALVGM